MSLKAVSYSSYTLISHCACTMYCLVFAVLTRWLLSVRTLLSLVPSHPRASRGERLVF